MTSYNAADEKQVEDQAEKVKSARDQELEDIKAIIETPAGLRMFKKMMDAGRIFSTSFTGNSQTFFLEGHRNFAMKYFIDIIEVTPHKVVDLMKKTKEDG